MSISQQATCYALFSPSSLTQWAFSYWTAVNWISENLKHVPVCVVFGPSSKINVSTNTLAGRI